MREAEVVAESEKPVTVKSLAHDLSEGGLKPGSTVLVHASLSSLGWVCGGPVALIQALLEVLTDEGTLVMPAHSTDLSDPSHWQNPPVPEEWQDTIRSEMPAYRPEISPVRGMGVTAETFRKYPGVRRSSHPLYSFAARGRESEFITENHEIEYFMGEGSPLAKIYELDGEVLLLGTDHDHNSSLHLAEHRADIDQGTVSQGAPVIEGGSRVWKEFEQPDYDNGDFIRLGQEYEQNNPGDFKKFAAGEAEARLYKQRSLVDYAAEWLEEKRTA